MRRLGIVFAVAMGLGGCMAGSEEPEATTTSVALDAFSDDAIAARLGAGWVRVEAGVFERHGLDGSVQRVAAGRSGLAADIARFRAEIDEKAASPERPATAAGEDYLQTLRTRVAKLEALQVQKDAQARVTSGCSGNVFFAESYPEPGYSVSAMGVRSGWSFGFSPRMPSEAYAYVGISSGGWPFDAREDFGNSYDPAYARLAWNNHPSCLLSAYAWVSPVCPEGYLSFSDYLSCN